MKNIKIVLCLFIACFSGVYLYAQELKWVYKIGGTTAEYGSAISIDSDQNMYDITNFMGSVVVGPNINYTSFGAEDILLRKSTSLGILQWVKQIGSKGQDLGYDVATDSDKNIYVVGTFTDSLFIDQQFVLSGNQSRTISFILKLSPEGTLLWIKKMDSDVSLNIRSVSAGLPDELVVSGSFEGNAFFGIGFTSGSNGGHDIFVAKLNSSTGNPIFLRRIGGTDQEFVAQHTRDNMNNIYLTGDFRQALDFDPGPGEAIFDVKGLTDAFVLKLSSAGTFQWVRTVGGIGLDYGQSIATDAQRNVIFTGRFSETVGFGNTTQVLQSKGGTDIFLAKLNENGGTEWVEGFGDINNDLGNRVIVNTNGIIYLAGIFRGKVDFNPSFQFNNSTESHGGADGFIGLYNQDGSYNEHFTLGGIANEQMNDLVLKNNGEVISTGGFGAIVDFDPGSSEVNIFSTGGLDAFLWNTFVCVNPYIKDLRVVKSEICLGEKILIQIAEGYLNSATQWSWQRDSCNNITFASGNFLNIPVEKNTSLFVKGFGGCVVNDECKKIDIRVFTDSLKYQQIDLCQGDTIRVGNNKYTAAGVFIDSLTSVSGCDSVVVTEISLFPKYFATQSFQICPGDTVRVGNTNYTFSGTFTNVFSSVHGCDSVIVTTINVLPTIIDNAEAIICEGESITIGNETYSASGTYIQSSEGENGCEDILIVKITALKVNFSQQVQICEGDSLKVGIKYYKTTGFYTDQLVSSYGCDSIISTQLTVIPHTSFNQEFSLCQGDSIKVGQKVYKNTGNFIDTLVNVNGCDSIVFTDIRVYPLPALVSQEFRICEGDSIVVGTKIYKTDGLYRDTLASINGCDSIIVTTLKVDQKLYFGQSEICRGDSIVIAGNSLSNSGVYTFNLVNNYGCDSIITYALTVNEHFQKSNEYRICPGDSVSVGSSVFKYPGNYSDTLHTSKGCDSILNSIIIWNHVDKNLSFAVCKGQGITVNGKLYKEAGFFRDTLLKSDGCDSILNITIIVHPNFVTDTLFEICKGESVTVGTGTYFNSGKFAEILESVNGCDSLVNFEIKIINFVPVFFGVRDTLKAFKIVGAEYQWYECINGEKVPYFGAVQSEFPLFKSGKYALSITFKGCTYFSDCLEFIVSGTGSVPVSNFSFYPNPVSDEIRVHIPESGWIKIRDAAGKLMYTLKASEGELVLNVAEYISGLYYLEFQNKNKNDKLKFIKL